ncbi:universal stress protein [Halegenticoccus tardaugens]|uniref:universal stress protein n=1 Tax=Halegenticoccus tardaugens TaxID=2071624 RepID=UPI00100C1C1D|nr:universal stress protein [Halegenticoccus tardaugens]
MSDRTLVPMDASEPSREALEYALATHPESEITVIHVLDPSEVHGYGAMEGTTLSNFDEIRREQEAKAEEVFATARELATERGVKVTTASETGSPARAIVGYAENNDVDRVVIGSHGRSGASRILLGSVAEKVARRSPVPVTIVR